MRFDGIQYRKDAEKKGVRVKIDKRVQAKIPRRIAVKTDTKSLTGLTSLSKELKNPKFLGQVKDRARIKKTSDQIYNKLNKSFRILQSKYSNILSAKPRLQFEIRSRRPRKRIQRYYVSANASAGGDGSQEQPFSTITQALEHAAEYGDLAIYLNISSGEYVENLEITRRTNLIGDNVTLRGSIENSNQHLTMSNIHIRDATGYGIRQTGGSLVLEYCSVMGTTNVAFDLETGTAIHLSNGTEASLNNFFLIENQGRALLLKGEGTIAEVRNVWIGSNTLDLQAIEQRYNNELRIGTVEVAGGAKLLMEHFILTDNFIGGIVIMNNSSAHLRFCVLDNTTGHQASQYVTWLGLNLVSFQNSVVEIRNFISQGAEAQGLHVDGAYLTAKYGDVRDCLLGLWHNNSPEDYDWSHCIDVQYTNNEYDIEGDPSAELAVPDTHMPLPGEEIEPTPEPPPPPPCKKVSWGDEDAEPRRG